jgi:hypothetical protein
MLSKYSGLEPDPHFARLRVRDNDVRPREVIWRTPYASAFRATAGPLAQYTVPIASDLCGGVRTVCNLESPAFANATHHE